MQCALESRELLSLCLKKIKSSMSKVNGISTKNGSKNNISTGTTRNVNLFSQVRLIDAGFLWTEPHSKRIKMKVTIQKEVRKQ